MLLHLNSLAFVLRAIAWSLGNRPAHQYPIPCKPKILVKTCGMVFLKHEYRSGGNGAIVHFNFLCTFPLF